MFLVQADSHCRPTTDSVVVHRAAGIGTVYGQHQNVRKTKNRNEYLEIYEVWHILRNP
jgi:hypothetical protein